MQWTDHPPDNTNTHSLPLRRVSRAPVIAICLSSKPLGAEVHFFRGRTRPHTNDGTCEACHAGQAPRWRGYLTLWDREQRQTWITEITPYAYDGLKEGLTSFGTLRGHTIKLERTKPNPNAPLQATVYAALTREEELPPEPDIRHILERIWDLDHDNAALQENDNGRFINHAQATAKTKPN
jgi:hypothetical protein